MRTHRVVELDAWGDAVAAADGPQLVVGGPGSGKTEFLVRRARHILTAGLAAPEQLLVLSFGRRGVAELRTRISAGLGSVSRVQAVTFHSLAMRIIEAHGVAGDWSSVPTLLTGPEQVELVAELLATEDPTAWPLTQRDLLQDTAFAEEVTDFMLRAAERLEDAASLKRRDRADWRALPTFIERYRAELVARSRIDYASLQVEALRLLATPGVRSATNDSARYILVDEYQDTTVAQAGLIEALGSEHGNVTVAGDPYQSIYGFRGAELTNLDEFGRRFEKLIGQDVAHLVLPSSFRVPAAILEAAVRITSGAGLISATGPMQPAGPGGSIETYSFDQQSAEADWIAAEIQRIHLRDKIPYERIAVLARSKRRFLPEVSRALERRRVPHERPDSRLVDHPAVRPIIDLARVAGLSDNRGAAAIRRILLGPLAGLSLSAARDIERTAYRAGWPQALRGAGLPDELVQLLLDGAWANEVPAAVGFWQVWTSLAPFVTMVTDPSRADDRRAIASFSQALGRLQERDPTASLAEYARSSETEDFEATPLLEYRAAGDRVTLTTLHQSKGMTFDIVFIADAREGVLPDLRSRDSLLGARHLSPQHGEDDAKYARFRLQEEMRLVYSAMCRAARRVVWTASTTGYEGGEGVPSRFLPLVTGTSMEDATRPPPAWHTPTTPVEAEAWLRRRAADPELPLVERVGAVAALIGGGSWQPRPTAEYAGMRQPGPDTGLVGHDPVLSASQADAYSRCPRQYAFVRRLRIDSGGSHYQELGSLVHDVLDRVERAAAQRGEAHATAEAARASLEEVFDPAVFGGDPWAAAWKARAEVMLEHLYAKWPSAGRGIGFEVEFEYRLGGVRWSGRMDRVEERTDGHHIVDYKTGRSAATKADAASSLQLGLYALAYAAQTGAHVAGAEYWYPAVGAGTRTSVAVVGLDTGELETIETRLAAIAAGILAEQWDPIVGAHCERCPVRSVCPEWPEGREAFLP